MLSAARRVHCRASNAANTQGPARQQQLYRGGRGPAEVEHGTSPQRECGAAAPWPHSRTRMHAWLLLSAPSLARPPFVLPLLLLPVPPPLPLVPPAAAPTPAPTPAPIPPPPPPPRLEPSRQGCKRHFGACRATQMHGRDVATLRQRWAAVEARAQSDANQRSCKSAAMNIISVTRAAPKARHPGTLGTRRHSPRHHLVLGWLWWLQPLVAGQGQPWRAR